MVTTPDSVLCEDGNAPHLSPNLGSEASVIDGNAELDLARSQWRQMLQEPVFAGEKVAVVPQAYLERVFTALLPLLAALVAEIGPIVNSALVDANGNLFQAGHEPEPSTHIPYSLYSALVLRFGAVGAPVARYLMEEGNDTVLERFAPFFVVHTLGKATPPVRSAAHVRTAFLLSQTKTFADLKSTVSNHLFRAKPAQFRVWFITTEAVEDLPAVIPVSTFVNKIQHRKLVGPSVMEATLQSQGIKLSRLHLVAEVADRANGKFPVDAFLAANEPQLPDSADLESGGRLGLSNLGNTCYMNLALQCLVHVPELNQYFLYDVYERELNRSNPLGNKGEIAVAFSNLLHRLFDPSPTLTYVSPRDFKYTIGRYSSMFHGYQQQDSQEFLSWLLDALHEDLNRIHDKPYCEKPELADEDVDNVQAVVDLAHQCWLQHKRRNDSIVVDLFTGLYQSTLVCPECSKKSVTFDPFSDLTLPLPVNKKWYHVFTVVDLSGHTTEHAILTVEVELSKSDNYDSLVAYLSDFLKVPAEHLFLFEVFRSFFYKDFQENTNRSKFLPVTEVIADGDTVVVYIIPHDVETDVIVPVINVIEDEDTSYHVREAFGVPLFVVLNRDTDLCSFGTIRKKVEQAVKTLLRIDLDSRYAQIKTVTKEFYAAEDFPLLKKPEDAVMVIDSDSDFDGSDKLPEGEDPAYDSDISLAHPAVGANYGFTIRYSDEDPAKRYQFRGLGRSRPADSVMHVPHGKPLFNDLPELASKLPKLKREYYHYPDYVASVARADQQEYVVVERRGSENGKEKENEDENGNGNGNEIGENENSEIGEASDSSETTPERPPPLMDEDTDSDSNWDHVTKLGASVDDIDPPADSETQSDVPSSVPEQKDNHPPLISRYTTLVADWDRQIYNELFRGEKQAWENAPGIPNPALEESKRVLALQQKSTVSLYDCLRNFSSPEVLGDQDLWFCPRCKEHRRATKTIQLWSTGDILTIHLKRFQSARLFSDKINMVVDFPIEGLDMSEYVSSHGNSDLLYDLIAVDNHYGALGGGHYTASAKNFRDGRWYYFNDGRVTPIDDPRECVTGAAYLLFYKKRGGRESPEGGMREDFGMEGDLKSDVSENVGSVAGGESVARLLREGRRAFEANLQALRELQRQVLDEIAQYNEEEAMSDSDDLYGEEDKKEEEKEKEKKEERKGEEEGEKKEIGEVKEERMEGGASEQATSAATGLVSRTKTKKSRSPMDEQTMEFEFESQRKQRLISKEIDLLRSVNINTGYSSSVSNLASPAGSSDDERENEK